MNHAAVYFLQADALVSTECLSEKRIIILLSMRVQNMEVPIAKAVSSMKCSARTNNLTLKPEIKLSF